MQSQPKLIIAGHGGTNVLYRGEGNLGSWKEKLDGEPCEQTYYLFEASRIDGASSLLEIKNECMLWSPADGKYISGGINEILFPLVRESGSILLGLLKDSEPEQGGR